jgi:hypothetical protein
VVHNNNRVLVHHKEELNDVCGRKMDGTGDYHVKQKSQPSQR